MAETIVFIHGAWMTPLCWDKFIPFFEAKGATCLAPAWPYHDRPIPDLRANPDPKLGHLTVRAIVDHFEAIIRQLDAPPVLIGHSFGGLFVQMLLDRGLGKAGVAIDPAPPKGVFQFYPSVLRANQHVLLTPGFWSRVLTMPFGGFQYAFVNTLPEAEQRAVYDTYVVPETGRIFFQASTSMFHNETRVDFNKVNRPPLLIIGGKADNIIPAAMTRQNQRKYRTGQVDYHEFEGKSHWIIGQPGAEAVAGFAANWIEQKT